MTSTSDLPTCNEGDRSISKLESEEARIQQGIRAFWQIGDALRNIRDGALYNEKGYLSFTEYCQKEWGFSYSRSHHLMDGAAVYEMIVAAGAHVRPTNESQVRYLAGVPAETAVKTWESAVERKAEATGNPDAIPSRNDVKEERERIQVEASRYGDVIRKMKDGDLTPSAALATVTALDSCHPNVMPTLLMAGVTDPTIIRELNRIALNSSDTYKTIVASGYVQFNDGTGVEIGKAKPFELRRMLDEAQAAHIAINTKQLFVGLYPDDPFRSYQELQSKLGREFLHNLIDAALSADVDLSLEFIKTG